MSKFRAPSDIRVSRDRSRNFGQVNRARGNKSVFNYDGAVVRAVRGRSGRLAAEHEDQADVGNGGRAGETTVH